MFLLQLASTLSPATLRAMILRRQIERLAITRQYSPFVNEVVRGIRDLVTDNLHSVYICGSIPRDEAVANRSDGDFTIVTREPLQENHLESLGQLKDRLIEKYPFIPKIDISVCTVRQVLSQQYEWGFWIGTVSRCVYGNELSEKLQPLDSPIELTKGLCADFEKVIRQRLGRIRSTSDPDQQKANCRKLVRRLIRALVALTIVAEDNWTDDLQESRSVLENRFPESQTLVDRLFMLYRHPIINENVLEELAAETMAFSRSKYAEILTQFDSGAPGLA